MQCNLNKNINKSSHHALLFFFGGSCQTDCILHYENCISIWKNEIGTLLPTIHKINSKWILYLKIDINIITLLENIRGE